MARDLFGYLEVLVFFLPVLAFLLWELYAVNRSRRRDAEASARAARHPHGQHQAHQRVGEPLE